MLKEQCDKSDVGNSDALVLRKFPIERIPKTIEFLSSNSQTKWLIELLSLEQEIEIN